MSYRSGKDPEENLPDWLKDLRKRQSKEPDSPKSEGESKDLSPVEPVEEEPDWLHEIRNRYGRSEPQQEQVDNDDEEERVLSDTQPVIREQEEQPAKQIEPESDNDLHAEEEPSIEEPLAESVSNEAFASKQVKPELPDWLEELGEAEKLKKTEEETTVSGLPPSSGRPEPELAPGELPGWLEALRPREILAQDETRSEELLPKPDVVGGPLAGLSGVLPAEPEAIQSVKPPVYSTRVELTDSQSQHVETFRNLIEDESKPKGDLSRQATLPARMLNVIISVGLLVAILIPLLTQSQFGPSPGADLSTQSVSDIIEALPSEAIVLIGFELQPATYGETRAAITAILTHILERKARLVFISTQPTGPGLAELLLREELADQVSVATGDYINLGYLSGGMAALRSFFSEPHSASFTLTALGSNPWIDPALESINRVSDFALVIVVASDADDARIWIEQGASELTNGLIAISSAQAAPLLRPYLQSQPQTLRGLVSGIQGAVIYEQLRSQEDGGGQDIWYAYSYGLGAILLIILLGGLYDRLIHMRSERTISKHTSEQGSPEF